MKDYTQETRDYFIAQCVKCIDEAKENSDDTIRPTNVEAFIAWKQRQISEIQAGLCDSSFTFRQRAYYLETGKEMALLP